MADITQVQTSQGTYTVYDSSKSRISHDSTHSYATTSHIHYFGSSARKGYSNWNTIGSINTTNNATTTAIQLASWGLTGYYIGDFYNKISYQIYANGGIKAGSASSIQAYNITVTAARPWVSTLLHGTTQARFVVYDSGSVNFTCGTWTGAARTISAKSGNIHFYGIGILNPNNMKTYKPDFIKTS